MPIEIKELNIRINVNPPGSISPSENLLSSLASNKDGSTDTNTIVAICVEQVLDILKNKMER